MYWYQSKFKRFNKGTADIRALCLYVLLYIQTELEAEFFSKMLLGALFVALAQILPYSSERA